MIMGRRTHLLVRNAARRFAFFFATEVRCGRPAGCTPRISTSNGTRRLSRRTGLHMAKIVSCGTLIPALPLARRRGGGAPRAAAELGAVRLQHGLAAPPRASWQLTFHASAHRGGAHSRWTPSRSVSTSACRRRTADGQNAVSRRSDPCGATGGVDCTPSGGRRSGRWGAGDSESRTADAARSPRPAPRWHVFLLLGSCSQSAGALGVGRDPESRSAAATRCGRTPCSPPCGSRSFERHGNGRRKLEPLRRRPCGLRHELPLRCLIEHLARRRHRRFA